MWLQLSGCKFREVNQIRKPPVMGGFLRQLFAGAIFLQAFLFKSGYFVCYQK